MAHDDHQTQSFNLSSSISSTTRIPILFTHDYEVWALHFEDYALGIEEHGETIWQAITEGTFVHTTTRRVIKTLKEYNDILVAHTNIPQDEKDKLMCNIKAFRIIRFALQADTLRLVSSCETSKEIWDRLQELYIGDADLEHSVQTTLLSDFGSFEQAPDETLTQTFNRYNHLLSRLLKYKIARTVIEQKVTFLNSLRSEWKAIVSTIKAHEQFKSYTLAKVMGIHKSHEKEITSEAKTTTGLGSFALVAKGKKDNDDDSESDFSDEDLTREEKALMVYNPKKIFKKNFSTFKNRSRQGNYNSEKPKEDVQKKQKSDDEKKLIEKKEQVKDEAYYAKKIADLKKDDASSAKAAFVVQEDSEYSAVEVCSEQRGYSTDGCQTSASCFAAKSVLEQVEECEAVVNKVRSILKSLNICSSSYDKELDDLRVSIKNEERQMRIEKLDHELVRARDGRGLHRMILPFLELKEDEVGAECYRCETIIISDFDESEMSEISVEDEVDCSAFVNNSSESKKNIVSENSVAFARIIENKGPQALNEQATVFPKIQIVPNQVFVKQGMNSQDITKLKVLVDNDNSDGCNAFFWSEPIENSDETKGLSEMTSWKSRGKYISGSLNRKDSFLQPGSIGTKHFSNSNSSAFKPIPTKCLTSASRIHKSPEELIAKRKQMNARYKKNLKERKQF
ncbi:hypothetical protein L2E82_30433 [Cichorium intybus]|uniref:Uncharacterized protein n=1 Tax=Cichorium intybus TaxID=13427 RepID=A0ACB9D089_CICIN|nr:hypothetical protein L2E82_30433 [Cichorium intybus]